VIDTAEAKPKRALRERGSGSLIPPRPGITAFWTVQVVDKNGRLVRRSAKVRGELKPGCNPKLTDSWTNITAAKTFLKDLIKKTDAGTITVGSDPSQIRYGALRQLYLNDYAEQEHKSLRTNADTDEVYVCGLKWLDQFFAYDESAERNPEDKGTRVVNITSESVRQFKQERQAAGAANGTINRALSALVRMFTLAVEDGKLQTIPVIKQLPEPKQPRQGVLGPTDYQKLYDILGTEVVNKATGRKSKPYAYVQPLLQTGYYTGMRLGEILGLRWSNIDLAERFIHLFADETKGESARDIPMIDGLPKMFESIKRADPKAGENDLVFTNNGQPIKSFIKAWRNSCVKAAIPTKKNGQVIVSRFQNGKYEGFLFHDLRRTAVSNMVQAGIDPLYAKAISGHKTDSVFERYNIIDTNPLTAAGKKLSEHLRMKSKEAAESGPKRRLAVAE
jgi:integrase